MTWKKGQSGNPGGLGAHKSKFTRKFWADFYNAWESGGPVAIEQMMKDDPAGFVRVAASLMPKELEATVRNLSATELSDDDLAAIAAGSGEGAAEAEIGPTITH